MSDKKKPFVPPTPPPMPLRSGAVSDASQNAPSTVVSIRRFSVEKKPSLTNIQPMAPSKPPSKNASNERKLPAESTRKSSKDETIVRRNSQTQNQPGPSNARPPQIPVTTPGRPGTVKSNPNVGPERKPSPPTLPSPSSAPPVIPFPKKTSDSSVIKRPSPTSVPPQPPRPPPKSSEKKQIPPRKNSGSKVTLSPPPPPQQKRNKMELNANYSILISGTESDSDASSIDTDAIQKVKELSERETAVFDAVSAGSLLTTKEALDSFKFDFNRRNIVGYTILHIATRRQDEDMVKLILVEGSNRIWPSVLKDTLLHAIKEVNVDLVRTILAELDQRGLKVDESFTTRRLRKDFLENRKLINEETEFINSEFHEDMTPLKLAAICDSYELVQLFHDRGHVLREPEPYVQRTKESQAAKNTDDIGPLRASYRRLHYYQAISKPAYIAFKANNCNHGKDTNCDPILVAFTLIKEVRQLADDDVFKKEYMEIADELQEFSCSIVQQCRKTEEIEEILEQTEGYFEASPYPRLSMALDMELKDFVSHRHCQQTLYRYWAGKDWPEWRVKDLLALFGHVVLRIFIWPLIALWSCLDRSSKFGRLLACPASAFLNSLVSYLYFVAFIFVMNVYNPDGPNHRGLPRTGVEYAVMVWVAGHILSVVKQVVTRSSSYLTNPWAWFDIFTNIFFVAAFVSWLYTPTDPALDRKHWKQHDPTLIAELLFSIASTMAYVRLLRIFQLNPKIGPLLTAVGRMLNDILNAMLFFVVIVLAFALGLSRLYRPYNGWSDVDPATKENITQTEAFSSFPVAIESLFWSIFSMGSSSDTNIIPRTIVSIRNPEIKSVVHMHFVEQTGKIMHAGYHVVVSLILLNMLLCMMSRTYELVNGNVDVEWKFARSKIWLSYGLDFVNPSPFNFIPSLSACMKHEKKGDEAIRKAEYYKLIKILIQRYFRDKAELASQEQATMESIEALQEDIAEFHSLLEKTEAEQYERNKTKAGTGPVRSFKEATPKGNDTDNTMTPPPPWPVAKMAQTAAHRFLKQRPQPNDIQQTPVTSPNVSSIYSDTSDDDSQFETVASYNRRLSQTTIPPTPPPPPPAQMSPSAGFSPGQGLPWPSRPVLPSQPPSLPGQPGNLAALGQGERRDSGSRNVRFPPSGSPSSGGN